MAEGEAAPATATNGYASGKVPYYPVTNNGKANGHDDDDGDGIRDLPKISLVDRFIDEPRPLRVAVIGGGLSGVLAGVLLPAKVPNIQLTIFDKNHDFVSLLIFCERVCAVIVKHLTNLGLFSSPFAGRHVARECVSRREV